MGSTGSRILRARLAWGAAVLVAAALGFWAARATFTPPDVAEAEPGVATVTVTEATVGRSVPFSVSAVWATTPLGVGSHQGVVTTIDVAAGDTVAAGDVLYTVDLRPVVVGEGPVPSFRALAEGATGADVAQLQGLLRATGHLRGAAKAGTFDAATTAAVTRWQKSLGVAQDGAVQPGDVVYASTLPARVVLDDAVAVGAAVAQGQTVVHAVGAVPDFAITLAASQQETAASLTSFDVTLGEQTVRAVVGSATEDEYGNPVLHLTREDGSPLCGDACSAVPLERDQAVYQARAVIVPEASGPAVPVAAVRTAGDGSTFVTAEDGTRVPVRVVSQGDGRAVVEGLDVGDVVRLFGDEG